MNVPLALYIHIPWCEKKCPYCDFNSHVAEVIPEQTYVEALCNELQAYAERYSGRSLCSIFIGGGTPSLFSAQSIATVLNTAERLLGFDEDIEITLEANPGSSEQQKFADYKAAGVNRLSIGIQSFNDKHLQRLGRIHNQANANQAIYSAQKAGFDRINIDLMYALGEQTTEEALADLSNAIRYEPSHISWYQLTIEQNTEYFKRPPNTPNDIITENMEENGRQLLAANGYSRYEISAYSKDGQESRHNLNYWEFGDYLGIGAGAHGKITDADGSIYRIANTRSPKDYLARNSNKVASTVMIDKDDISAEFMMNALRLKNGVDLTIFQERTGLSLTAVASMIERCEKLGLMRSLNSNRIECTERGYAMLNSVIEQFI